MVPVTAHQVITTYVHVLTHGCWGIRALFMFAGIFSYVKKMGHDKIRNGVDLWGGLPLVSFNHVTDPHFVTFSISLYMTKTKMAADRRCCSVDPQP